MPGIKVHNIGDHTVLSISDVVDHILGLGVPVERLQDAFGMCNYYGINSSNRAQEMPFLCCQAAKIQAKQQLAVSLIGLMDSKVVKFMRRAVIYEQVQFQFAIAKIIKIPYSYHCQWQWAIVTQRRHRFYLFWDQEPSDSKAKVLWQYKEISTFLF